MQSVQTASQVRETLSSLEEDSSVSSGSHKQRRQSGGDTADAGARQKHTFSNPEQTRQDPLPYMPVAMTPLDCSPMRAEPLGKTHHRCCQDLLSSLS